MFRCSSLMKKTESLLTKSNLYLKNLWVRHLTNSPTLTLMFHKSKERVTFSCINFSCGYYNMHTANEFVVVKDVEDAFNMAVSVVKDTSGLKKYEYTYEVDQTYSNYSQGSLFANYADDSEEYYDDDFEYQGYWIGLTVTTTTFTSGKIRLKLSPRRLVM